MSDAPYEGTTQRYRMPRAEIPGCTLVQDLIPLYLDGEVSHESHALMADHLSHCERCSGYLAGARTVRGQILREQQTLRHSATIGSSVAAVQQPIRESTGLQLWRLLMAVTYLGGLGLTGHGLLESSHYPGTHPALIAGLVAVLTSTGGLVAAGEHRNVVWRLMMTVTWLVGLFSVITSMIDPLADRGTLFVSGALLLALATWRIWPRRATTQASRTTTRTTGSATRTPKTGAGRAMLTAMIATLSAMMCVGVIALGLTLLLDLSTALLEPRLLGTGMIMVGGAGLLVLNRRMGWLPQLATAGAMRLISGYALLIGGALLGSLVLSAVLGSLLPLLAGLALAGVLIVFGLRLARRERDSGRHGSAE